MIHVFKCFFPIAYLSLAFGGGALCLEANNGSIVISKYYHAMS